MASLRELLGSEGATLREVQARLGALDGPARIAECLTLGPRQQARLFALAASGAPLAPEDLVAAARGDEPVPWSGRNSLPAFTRFEKHFRRHEGRVVGYNRNSALVRAVAGDGYYVCRVDPARPSEVLIDYTLLPATAPEGWPRVVENRAGLRRLVYGNLHDYCRRVSDGVVIGAATRLGRPIGQYFVLCRG